MYISYGFGIKIYYFSNLIYIIYLWFGDFYEYI